jgi:hypothetical protein
MYMPRKPNNPLKSDQPATRKPPKVKQPGGAHVGKTLPPLKEYPFELVAQIASSLLEENGFREAAERAFALLDAVSEFAVIRQFKDRLEHPQVWISFNDAMPLIVGGRDREHSVKKYREFLEQFILPQAREFGGNSAIPREGTIAHRKYVDQLLKDQRGTGFGKEHAAMLAGSYQIWRSLQSGRNPS